jgi:hypothetical protein
MIVIERAIEVNRPYLIRLLINTGFQAGALKRHAARSRLNGFVSRPSQPPD